MKLSRIHLILAVFGILFLLVPLILIPIFFPKDEKQNLKSEASEIQESAGNKRPDVQDQNYDLPSGKVKIQVQKDGKEEEVEVPYETKDGNTLIIKDDSKIRGGKVKNVKQVLAATDTNRGNGKGKNKVTPTPTVIVGSITCLQEMSTRPLLVKYLEYIKSNPNIAKAFNPCRYSSGLLSQFFAKLEQAEQTGQPPTAPLPDTFKPLDPNISYVRFGTQQDEINGAKLAHILYIEVNHKVPWRLAAYSDADLLEIFKLGKFPNGSYGGVQIEAIDVLDYSPKETWDVVNSKINLATITNQKQAVVEILKHTRKFRHGGQILDANGNVIFRNNYGIVTVAYMANEGISRAGCWSMVNYLVSLASNLNIPASGVSGYYAANGHATGTVRINDQVLSHGDDVYNGLMADTPSSELMDTYTHWDAEVLRYGAYNTTGGFNSMKHMYDMALKYPAKYLTDYWCRYPATSKRQFLLDQFGNHVTSAQLDQLEVDMLRITNNCTVIPENNPDG